LATSSFLLIGNFFLLTYWQLLPSYLLATSSFLAITSSPLESAGAGVTVT